MQFVVVGLGFECVDGLLPVGRKDIAVLSIQTLTVQILNISPRSYSHSYKGSTYPTLAQVPEYSSGPA